MDREHELHVLRVHIHTVLLVDAVVVNDRGSTTQDKIQAYIGSQISVKSITGTTEQKEVTHLVRLNEFHCKVEQFVEIIRRVCDLVRLKSKPRDGVQNPNEETLLLFLRVCVVISQKTNTVVYLRVREVEVDRLAKLHDDTHTFSRI